MHLAIIPDGNRRFGKENAKDGHFEGMKNILKTIVWFSKKRQDEIKELTLFCFSEENWKRSKEEVGYLMKLFEMMLDEVDHFIRNAKLSPEAEALLCEHVSFVNDGDDEYDGLRGHVSGEGNDGNGGEEDGFSKVEVNFAITSRENFSKEINEKIESISSKTRSNNPVISPDNKRINLCVSYTGKSEIVNAVNKLVEDHKPLTLENIESELLVKSFPDLVIRSSGEQRLSGFLPWQTCYSEFMFIDKHWPDVSIKDLEECIGLFKKRNRRFGK